MSSVVPGERWVALRGPHAGNEVEIVRTNGSSIEARVIGGGKSWGKQKSADQTYHIRQDVFGKNYGLASEQTPGDAHGGGKAFRQKARPRSVEPAPPTTLSVQPVLGLISTGGSDLNIEVLTITPELARAWLDRGGKNRKISERRVAILVAVIQRGEWHLTGEAIKLDADGTVRDGQHRLEAIARTGIAVQSVVVRGIIEQAFNYIDTGRHRTAVDVLTIHGYRSEVLGLAAAARGVLLIERYGRYTVHGTLSNVPPATILAYVQAHPELEEGVALALQLKRAGFWGGPGVWGTILTLLLRVDAEACRYFVAALASGANLDTDSPILRLRNRSIGERQRSSSTDEGRETLVAVAIKAWNFWRRGEKVRSLTWHGQAGRNPEAWPVAE